VQCIAPSGGMPPDVAQDAKNAAFQTSVPLDMSQLQTAGFQTVRLTAIPRLPGSRSSIRLRRSIRRIRITR